MSFDLFQTYNYDPKNPDKKIELASIDEIPSAIALKLYSFMVRLRRMDERLIEEYHPADEMRCPVHFCIGQEVLPAALNLTLKHEDYLFSHHRTHGFYLAKVPSMNSLFAEMYGRETGANGGKAGSQDISVSEHHFYSGAILAGGPPIATGVSIAMQLNKEPYVAVAAAGDGASDEGVYWESLNYAALRKLPVLFLCENNFYSTFSPQFKHSAAMNIAERAKAFGLNSRAFFGNDVVRAYQEVSTAIDAIRRGEGPVFLETFTYRWNGHVGPENDDWNNYRPKEELEYWKKLCPIMLMERQMIAKGLLNEQKKKAIYDEVEAEINSAFKFAKESLFPEGIDLEKANLSQKSPMADSLLRDEYSIDFNQNQSEVLPGPY